jgi:hypothetical protein
MRRKRNIPKYESGLEFILDFVKRDLENLRPGDIMNCNEDLSIYVFSRSPFRCCLARGFEFTSQELQWIQEQWSKILSCAFGFQGWINHLPELRLTSAGSGFEVIVEEFEDFLAASLFFELLNYGHKIRRCVCETLFYKRPKSRKYCSHKCCGAASRANRQLKTRLTAVS